VDDHHFGYNTKLPNNNNNNNNKQKQRGVCVTHYGLAIYNKKKYLLRQKKNYGNSNISPCKNIIFKKIFF
jgi:hypothetical protein